MANFTPVDYDPFAVPPANPSRFEPVDLDPFAQPTVITGTVPVHDDRVAPAGGVDRGALGAAALGVVDAVPFAGDWLKDKGLDAAAGIMALRSGKSFDEARAIVGANAAATEAAHPIVSTLGRAAGGVAGSLPMVLAAPEAFGAGAGSLLARTAMGAGGGAAVGAADSAIRSGGDLRATAIGGAAGLAGGALGPAIAAEGRPLLAQAALGTLGGGTLGAGIGAAQSGGDLEQTALSALGGVAGGAMGPALGAGAGALMRRGAGTPAGIPGFDRAASDYVFDKFKGEDIAALRDRAAALGPDATLADLSPTFTHVARGIASLPGQRSAVVAPYDARATGVTARVGSDLDAALGPAQSAAAARQTIADAGRAVTEPYFLRSDAAGLPPGGDLDALLGRPAVASAMADAATAAANRGAPLPTVLLDRDGQPVGSDAALRAYEAGQRPAVVDALARMTGSDPALGPLAATDALTARRSADADPLYARYRSLSVPMTPDLAEVLNRPSVRAALPEAERRAQDQGRTIYARGGPEPEAGGSPDIPDPATRQITPEGLDYLKRTLGDRIDAAGRAGERDDARVFTGLQQQLLGAIENHPDPTIADAYRAARGAYAGPSREMEALNRGRDAVGDAVTPEAVQREFAALGTDGERQRYRDGVFSALRDRLGRASDTANFVRTVAGNQALRDKFAAIAPHPEALTSFNAAMDRARATFTEAQRPTPEAWRQALDALDARAKKGEPGIAEARDALAGLLARNPDFARGRSLQTDYAGLLGALDDGRSALRGGPSALHPTDFADRFAARTPAAQAAERLGMGSDLDRTLGVAGNDALALRTALQGPEGWNGAKISEAFGPGAREALERTVDREGTFAATRNTVAQGTATAPSLGIMRELSPGPFQPWQPFPETWGPNTITGTALDLLARRPVNALARALQKPRDLSGRDADIGRLVSGPADAVLPTLEEMRRQALIDALVRRRLGQAGGVASLGVLNSLAKAVLDRVQKREERLDAR